MTPEPGLLIDGKTHVKSKTAAPLLLTVLLIAGCQSLAADEMVSKATASPTRQLETPTSTVTLTPTSSPTATATAPAALLLGNPRAAQLSDPVPQSGAPCGFVDTLDFPLDPPEGDQVNGGSDFGVFRDRYNGFHTGEDWGFGRGSFGQPVYSIGHGRITYAQPNGWGADKGVVIIRHTYREGGSFLSFYGHLDPPSLQLRAGQCVGRGDKIGEIGRPRTSPHLHFEIRLHLPETPGPGYWSIDPSKAGWKPPSDTIWGFRNSSSPGIVWSHPGRSWLNLGLGAINDETFLAISDEHLVSIRTADGELAWRHPLPPNVTNALLDVNRRRVYLSTSSSEISAFQVADFAASGLWNGEDLAVEPLWVVETGLGGRLDLVPLPAGGLLAANRNGVSLLSREGVPQLNSEEGVSIVDWEVLGDTLLLSTLDPEAPLWSLEDRVINQWEGSPRGRLAVTSTTAWLYDPATGVYKLGLESHRADLVLPLSKGLTRLGDLLPLDQGSLLLLHADMNDRRLILLNDTGELLWERSLRRLPAGNLRMVAGPVGIYLILYGDHGNTQTTEIYAVDLMSQELHRLFSGGTRGSVSFSEDTWGIVSGGRIIFNIARSSILALDPGIARNAVLGKGGP